MTRYEIYGAPTALTGSELVTIRQMQNGNLAFCTMTLSALLQWVVSQDGALTQGILGPALVVWAQSLPIKPGQPGQFWNNGGVISLS